MSEQAFMQRALAIALEKMRANDGGPFGALVVRDGEIIAEGWNQVTSTNDPTAHAEVVAIRRACEKLGTFNLSVPTRGRRPPRSASMTNSSTGKFHSIPPAEAFPVSLWW